MPFTQIFDINPPNIDSLKKIESLKTQGRKIILYQGVINIGRGLEWMIDAMVLVDNAIFCIIGDGDIANQIKSKISDKKLEDRIFMLGKITPDILPHYTRLADLGVNLLEHRGLNQYYALPNRIFDFIQAEVPILSTDFPEIRTITHQYSVGKVIDKYDAQSLSMTINVMLKEWETKPNRKEIFTKAKRELCWEEEKSVLLNLFQKI
ncbi:MAG: glycosyltransferase [Bacteroidales bacterium]